MSPTNVGTNKETEAWLDEFVEKMSKPDPHEVAKFEERRRLGLGVGLDSKGNLVHASGKPLKSLTSQ